jgi:thiazole/oxazole-forming peptide maturase SagD family component
MLCEWTSVESLRERIQNEPGTILLMEGGPDGAVLVGPSFESATGPCIDCYIKRRRANGGNEIRPHAGPLSAGQSKRLAETLEKWRSNAGLFAGRQYEIHSSGKVSMHVLLAAPHCGCCKMAERCELVSSRLGLVHRLTVDKCERHAFYCSHAVGCRSDALGPTRALNHGFAAAILPEEASLRATMESVERYSAAFWPDDLTFGCQSSLKAECWGPDRFSGFGKASDGRPLSWAKGRELHTGQEIRVPASVVYLPYQAKPGERLRAHQSSSGLAIRGTLEGAIEHGLLELVERDSFLRSWGDSGPLEQIDTAPIPLDGLHLSRIPEVSAAAVVVAFIESPEPPYTACGVAARLDANEAASAATMEAVACQESLLRELRVHREPPRLPPRRLRDHALAHALYPELAAARRRWLFPQLPARCPEPLHTWAGLLAHFREVGFVELTTRDVAGLGLHVVRVFAPDILSLEQSQTGAAPHPIG